MGGFAAQQAPNTIIVTHPESLVGATRHGIHPESLVCTTMHVAKASRSTIPVSDVLHVEKCATRNSC